MAQGAEWPGWLALVVSTAAFLKSLHTDSRSRRIEQADAFDRRFGDQLREQLRNLGHQAARLKAFYLPSGQTLAQLQAELPALMIDLEDSASQVKRLLQEIHNTPGMALDGWFKEFDENSKAADEILEDAATKPHTQKADFHNDISRASNLYLFAMKMVTNKLHGAKLPR